MKEKTMIRQAVASTLHLSAEGLEAQVASRLASHLSLGTGGLVPDITERLRFSRERALNVARQKQRVQAPARAVAQAWQRQGQQATLMGGPPPVWLRMASAFPLLVLLAGLVLIQHHHQIEQIQVAAEIDSALLADELPPDAYGDPGFSEYLRRTLAP